VPGYRFRGGRCWSELPGGSLLITGGDYPAVREVVKIDTLTWELMQLKVHQAALRFSCFKIGTQVYLVIWKTLYSFTPLQVKPIKTIAGGINCLASYYSRGTLYCDNGGGIRRSILGELTSLLVDSYQQL
jgi:hypothetical protein